MNQAVMPNPSPELPPEEVVRPTRDRLARVCLIGLFLIFLVGTFYLAAGFLIPVTLAFLLSLVLSPLVRSQTQVGIPPPLSAAAIVATLVGGLFFGAYFLSGPVSELAGEVPATLRELQFRLDTLMRPMREVEEATASVGNAAGNGKPGVQKVMVEDPGLLSRVATGAPEVLAGTGLTLFLLYFLLASGDLFHAKLIRVLPTMSDKKLGLRIAQDIERQVSRYLFTITLINIGLGAAVAGTMFLLGLPNPILWGVIAAGLNYIPYLGGLIGVVLVGLAAFAAFDSIWQAIPVSGCYALLTAMEGNFVTPALVGRRLELNAVVVLASVAFWTWLWGFVGALVAVPILVVIKVFADNIEAMHGLGEFLSARETHVIGDD